MSSYHQNNLGLDKVIPVLTRYFKLHLNLFLHFMIVTMSRSSFFIYLSRLIEFSKKVWFSIYSKKRYWENLLWLREKCLYSEFLLVRFFPHLDWIRTRKTPNTDTFHAVFKKRFLSCRKKRVELVSTRHGQITKWTFPKGRLSIPYYFQFTLTVFLMVWMQIQSSFVIVFCCFLTQSIYFMAIFIK